MRYGSFGSPLKPVPNMQSTTVPKRPGVSSSVFRVIFVPRPIAASRKGLLVSVTLSDRAKMTQSMSARFRREASAYPSPPLFPGPQMTATGGFQRFSFLTVSKMA